MSVADAFLHPFSRMRQRSKIAVGLVVAVGVIVFWKGVWGMAEVVFDQWLFGGQNALLSNAAAAAAGLLVLLAAGASIRATA